MTDSATHWTTGTVAHGYDARDRRVQITAETAVWYHAGKPVVPLRWGLVRDPQGRFEPQALRTTHQQLAPAHVLTYFIRRWQMAATVAEARAHLGLATQRQWSDTATARTTPVVLALSSIVPLIAAPLRDTNTMPVRTAAWYRKEAATVSATMALVRRWLWAQAHVSMSQTEADAGKIPRALFDRLTDALCYAA